MPPTRRHSAGLSAVLRGHGPEQRFIARRASRVALLSGCAEEYLFRGALQQKFGLIAATLVFAVIHWPLNPNFLPWPFVAGVIGLGLGVLARETHSLVAPAAAHVVMNFINLRRITQRFAVWDEERANRYVDSGKDP